MVEGGGWYLPRLVIKWVLYIFFFAIKNKLHNSDPCFVYWKFSIKTIATSLQRGKKRRKQIDALESKCLSKTVRIMKYYPYPFYNFRAKIWRIKQKIKQDSF